MLLFPGTSHSEDLEVRPYGRNCPVSWHNYWAELRWKCSNFIRRESWFFINVRLQWPFQWRFRKRPSNYSVFSTLRGIAYIPTHRKKHKAQSTICKVRPVCQHRSATSVVGTKSYLDWAELATSTELANSFYWQVRLFSFCLFSEKL